MSLEKLGGGKRGGNLLCISSTGEKNGWGERGKGKRHVHLISSKGGRKKKREEERIMIFMTRN